MKTRFIKYTLFLLLSACISGCDDYNRTAVEKAIYVNKESLVLFVGEQIKLTASPTDGTYQYQWTSEDPSVATVTAEGLIEAVGEGFTNIVISSGDIKTKVEVTSIIRIPLEDVQLSETSLELQPGSSKTIIVNYIPDNANDIAEYKWSSEDEEIAVVNEGGEIIAMAEGNTNIVYQIGDIVKKISVFVAYTRPFNGPHILSSAQPCTIQAADFDFGGEGYAFHDIDESNAIGNDNYRKGRGDSQSYAVEIEGEGTDIGYTNTGEWLQYTVDVEDEGDYLVDISLSAAGDNGKIHLEVDGIDVTGTITIPNNGSWNDWRWYPSPGIVMNLTSGRHKIKYYFEGSDHNLKALRFIKK
ncbi:Ig-like domain-containing protein [Parabacteroides sp. Marseille-P3160]|uniref:Ig-like domain-containing protein n=1 Tax=Parabacteroides sp. Marseille-P3160 TaxID=1917887 RepID=UPI0009BB9DEF|nr:Ig-like domain-containing protein [Parabacteroides sp. Marseille-P3160]